ncbi:hypothetical protein [Streptomyces sp. KLOTTS4A1]|uniref:hypothetical protein n=1 Tax=Streptomyces sp. KLOTTS4A1 TaxID=3390996 RepID=UPI0039F4C8E0
MNSTPGQAPVPPANPPKPPVHAPPVPTPPAPAAEQRGCLFALSQPPLMIFLGVIGCLLLAAAVHDIFLL